MKDIEGDTKHKIPTIPVTLGLETTIILLTAINLTTFLIVEVGTFAGLISPLMHLPNIFSMMFTSGYIYLTYHDQKFTKRWYNPSGKNIHFICDVLVDGEYIAMAIPLYLYLLIK